VPRSGGTAMQTFFNHFPQPPWQDSKQREIDHYRLKDYAESNDYNSSYFKFCFVRNPWSKLVSEFFYKKNGTKIWPGPDPRLINCKNINFSSFVRALNLIDFSSKTHWESAHLIPQVDFIKTKDSKIDFVGRFENLQEDFNTVCRKIGIAEQQLPYKNKSNHKHYTEYYDNETREIVAEKYARDIEYFGYEFGE